MSYQVNVLDFEGPLDLLLQLVEQARLSASDVSLAAVTEQYIGHINQLPQLDAAETSRFSVVAAKLLYIKSAGLLPDGEDLEETAELEQQLAAYGSYRQAAAVLSELLRTPRQSWSRPSTLTDLSRIGTPGLTTDQLRKALQEALDRQTPPVHAAPRPTISLQTMIKRLQAASGTSLQAFFGQLESRQEIVVAFLAALELWRRGQLQLIQKQQFSIIQVDYATTR